MPIVKATGPRAAHLRDAGVDLLKRSPAFANASRRLLADLIDVGGGVDLIDPRFNENRPYFLLVVIEGQVGLREERGSVSVGPGVYLRRPERREERISTEESGAAIFQLRTDPFRGIVSQSLALARGLDPDLMQSLELQDLAELTELVWLTREAGSAYRLEPFLHLLGAGVSRLTRRHVAALSLSSNPAERSKIAIWTRVDGEPTFLGWEDIAAEEEQDQLAGLRDGSGLAHPVFGLPVGTRIGHAYFAHPAAPNVRPPLLANAGFHRIVYLTAEQPNTVPDPPLGLLFPFLRAGPKPPFSCFVPMLVRDERPAPDAGDVGEPDEDDDSTPDLGEALSDLAARAVALLTRRHHVETEILPDVRGDEEVQIPEWWNRPQRDRVKLVLDLAKLGTTWRAWQANPGGASFDSAYEGAVGSTTTADASARAVMNRRVGIALSGGGACAYRANPFLELLKERVPIDVFAGVSGGAFVGAYFCAEKLPGLHRAVAEGPFIGRYLPLAALASALITGKIDDDLGSRRVEELQEEFLAVTVLLAGESPPTAAVISGGTLGEAVRASGALPLGFGPMQVGPVRFADGAGAGVIPVHVLQAYGADFTIAFNCVPGPRHSNPWHESTLGRLSHELTLWGRIVDIWAWSAFMVQQTSRLVSQDADVFFEFDPQEIPFREALDWSGASDIVDLAKQQLAALTRAADDAQDGWLKLGNT